jgi:hypothetical protein
MTDEASVIESVKNVPGVANVIAVGSRRTCDPAPTNTDSDYLVLCGDSEALRTLFALGFNRSTTPAEYAAERENLFDSFLSFRRGDVNLIVTGNPGFFTRFMAATTVAKRLNLLQKADRVALFQAVLYGNSDRENLV